MYIHRTVKVLLSSVLGASLLAVGAGAGASAAPITHNSPDPNSLLDDLPIVAPGEAAHYKPSRPTRLLDTRMGRPFGLNGPLRGGTTHDLPIDCWATETGTKECPTTVVLNIAATGAKSPGFLTVYPADQEKPAVSSLNYTTNDTVANMVIVPVSADRKVRLYAHSDTSIVVDYLGAFANPAAFVAVPAQRLLDTRESGSRAPVPGGTSQPIRVAGTAGVPLTGVDSVLVNLIAVDPDDTGFLTVYPGDQERPTTSNISYTRGVNQAGLVLAKVSPDGILKVHTHSDAHLVADVIGYLPQGATYQSVPPNRILDTRDTANFSGDTKLPVNIKATGKVGVPEARVNAVAITVTAVDPTKPGYVSAWATGAPQLVSSMLNHETGQNRSNATIVPVGENGYISLKSSAGAHLIVDVIGYLRD